MKKVDYLKEGQKCYLHYAGAESEVFEYGSEDYQEAIEGGWSHDRCGDAVEVKDDEQNNEGDLVDNSGSGETLVVNLSDEDLIDLFNACTAEVVERDLDADFLSEKEREYIAADNIVTDNAIDIGKDGDLLEKIEGMELPALRILCTELGMEGIDKANGKTCIKKIKEYVANKDGQDA